MNNPVIDEHGNQHWYNTRRMLHRTDGPAYIGVNGIQVWCYNNRRHRIDGPAWIDTNGHQEWYVNGELHRTDGPSVIWVDGHQEWYLNGERKIKNKSFQKAANLTDEEMTLIILKYGNVT